MKRIGHLINRLALGLGYAALTALITLAAVLIYNYSISNDQTMVADTVKDVAGGPKGVMTNLPISKRVESLIDEAAMRGLLLYR